MLTTECVVTDAPEPKKDAPGGHAGHHHGMGDMGDEY
jgi:hypothetical protein